MSAEIYAARRARLAAKLGDGVAILHGAPTRIRSNDTDYSYRQDSDFFYLTGLVEPGAICVLAPGPTYTVFVRPRDRDRETWEGRCLGVERAVEALGADAAYSVLEFKECLPELLGSASRIYTDLNLDENVTRRALGSLHVGRRRRQKEGSGVRALEDVGALLHGLRLIKDAEELALMRRSAELAGAAHSRAMAVARPGMLESELEAEIDYVFRRGGGSGPAYGSIVASGANGTILHYVDNNRRMEDGDLVLIDAGVELGLYCSDVTRTFPVSGRFTSVQRAAYEVVLEAQLAAIDVCRSGLPQSGVHEIATRHLVEGMIELGLVSGSVDSVLESGDHRRFYMHGTSHWLGLDVHDVGAYKENGEACALEPGMVLTVEPGLYVREDEEGVPDELRGLGIRIEDDVLVTSGNPEVLSDGVPKDADEVEALVGSSTRVVLPGIDPL